MFASPRILGALAILIILALIAGWIWNDASDDALNKIERQNNEAGDQSDRARARYDLCVDGGGMYDFATGDCSRSAPRVGTDLIGARGATPADQRKIDRTVVGICAADVWTQDECRRYGKAGG